MSTVGFLRVDSDEFMETDMIRSSPKDFIILTKFVEIFATNNL